jgi:hypothetical protein
LDAISPCPFRSDNRTTKDKLESAERRGETGGHDKASGAWRTARTHSAAAKVAAWQAAVDKAVADEGKVAPAATLAEKIQRLVVLDEVGRQYLWLWSDPRLPQSERLVALEEIGARLSRLDAANTAALLPLIPRESWFSTKRDGPQIAHGAWLIVQHSPDDALRKRVLAAMEPLLRRGEADPHDYALLYDRVLVHAGSPQRYGTQAVCRPPVGAVNTLAPIEDAAGVDRRRAAIGWGVTLAETMGDLEIGKPC